MNDRQLNYVLEIAKQGSVTAAAKNLYVSQPSLSNMLIGIEHELGVKLFERDCTPLRPTYAGQLYIESAQKILSIKNEFEQHVADIRTQKEGRLRIGCGREMSSVLLPEVMPAYAKRKPGVQIKLREEKISDLQDLLMAREIDLAFLQFPMESAEIKTIPFYQEEIILLAPANFTFRQTHPNQSRKYPVADISELNGAPFVLFKPGNQLRTNVDYILDDYQVTPDIILETTNFETCIRMPEAGVAFSFFFYSSLDAEKNIFIQRCTPYCLTKPRYRNWYICYRKESNSSELIEDFVRLILKWKEDSFEPPVSDGKE